MSSIQNTIRNMAQFVSEKFDAFKRWINSIVTKLLIKMAIKNAKYEIQKNARKTGIVVIPVLNFGLTLSAIWQFQEAMITLEYILTGSIAESWLPIAWSFFWQHFTIFVICAIAILVLNELWKYCATYVVTRNSLYL